jgi:hypothetical protein
MTQETSSNLFELQIDQQAASYLGETAKWAKFLAIMGFIVCVIVVIAGIVVGAFMGTAASTLGGDSAPFASRMGSSLGGAIAIVYILVSLLYFFPCFYLFKFASKMQVAIRGNDQNQLISSFANLKSCFKFLGILTIIILSFYLLAFIIGALASGFR